MCGVVVALLLAAGVAAVQRSAVDFHRQAGGPGDRPALAIGLTEDSHPGCEFERQEATVYPDVDTSRAGCKDNVTALFGRNASGWGGIQQYTVNFYVHDQQLRDNPECAQQEYDRLLDAGDPGSQQARTAGQRPRRSGQRRHLGPLIPSFATSNL